MLRDKFGPWCDNLRLAEGWKKVSESAAEGDRENTAGVVEDRKIGLIPRIVVFRGNCEPVGEGPPDCGSDEHYVVATLRGSADRKGIRVVVIQVIVVECKAW